MRYRIDYRDGYTEGMVTTVIDADRIEEKPSEVYVFYRDRRVVARYTNPVNICPVGDESAAGGGMISSTEVFPTDPDEFERG